MKCEICKKNEAQFYYKESINGKTTEKHLCAECAHKEGLDRIFEHEANSMLTSFGKMMDSFLLPDVDFFGFWPSAVDRRDVRAAADALGA